MSRVELLREDRSLTEHIEAEQIAEATRAAVAESRTVAPGAWKPQEEYADRVEWLGLLILDGFVLRTIQCTAESSTELLGPGDMLRPWDHDGEYPIESITTSWSVLEPLRVALLDDVFALRVARWPSILAGLIERVGRRSRYLSVRLTISQLNRSTARVCYLLWHLAERWGRVTPEGVVIPIGLNHGQIADLIGTHRPSVTTALGELGEEGLVSRRDDGTWLVPPDLPDRLDRLLRE